MKPVLLKYNYGTVSPAYDVAPIFPLYIFQNCLFDFECTVFELPPFVPNEYMFTKHAGRGKEKWEVYASCLRDVMAKAGELNTSNIHYAEKRKYQELLGLVKPAKKSTKCE